MDIYFDESGNTGSVRNNSNRLNYGNQRHFALCGVVFEDENDKERLKQKYKALKDDFNIIGELKGNSLLTRKHNALLFRFIDEILDDSHFKINIYDKNFYLVTKMLAVLSGTEFKEMFPLPFYQLASSLITENDEILVRYCQLEENITMDNLKDFLEFLHDYAYRNTDNLIVSEMTEKIFEHELENGILDELFGLSQYSGTNIKNIVNLSTLSELLLTLKYESGTNMSNQSINIYHDKIDGFSKVFKNELTTFGINVNFIDSADNSFIQLADNAASIYCKVKNQMVSIFEKKKEWQSDSEWILELVSKLFNKIKIDNVKFTLPIQNWAVSVCVKEMFSPSYPKIHRNNFHFNNYYLANLSRICDEIDKNMGMDADMLLEILQR
jgi:hypothetical protein